MSIRHPSETIMLRVDFMTLLFRESVQAGKIGNS